MDFARKATKQINVATGRRIALWFLSAKSLSCAIPIKHTTLECHFLSVLNECDMLPKDTAHKMFTFFV